MDEELLEYLYSSAVREGYKKSKDDFRNLINKDDEVVAHIHSSAIREGYKGDLTKFTNLVRGGATAKQPAPVATTEPAKTEVATTIPVAETKPTVTPEPTKELRS
jgi:DNA primase